MEGNNDTGEDDDIGVCKKMNSDYYYYVDDDDANNVNNYYGSEACYDVVETMVSLKVVETVK